MRCVQPRIVIVVTTILALGPIAAAQADITAPTDTVVWGGGRRVPLLTLTKKGTLLAFSGHGGGGDNAPGDSMLKRSEDNGVTWSEEIFITTQGLKTGTKYQSRSVVADMDTGVIWVFLNKGIDRFNAEKPPMRFTFSEDDGRTWAPLIEPWKSNRFEKDLAPLRSVNGCGLHLSSGRLLAPCYPISPKGMGPAYLRSDDHGKTWRLGRPAAGGSPSVEFTSVELVNGDIYMNARRSGGHGNQRRVSFLTTDGGITWGKPKEEKQLPATPCHAGVIRLTDERRHDKNRLLFSSGRGPGVTIHISYDEGKTWEKLKCIAEKGSYSDLVVFPDMTIGCAYETHDPRWCSIRFARFALEWLTDGKDKIVRKEKPARAETHPDSDSDGVPKMIAR